MSSYIYNSNGITILNAIIKRGETIVQNNSKENTKVFQEQKTKKMGFAFYCIRFFIA